METKERILWIDGLKGLSCLFIFLHHFYTRFYPETFYGNLINIPVSNKLLMLSHMPFNFFLNGNFFVFIFIILSGFVSIYNIKLSKTFNMGVNFINTIIKLSIPLLIYEITVIILYRIKIINYFFIGNPSIKDLLISNAFKTFLLGDTRFGGHFWMLPFIFIGGTFVKLIGTISLINEKNMKSKLILIYLIISIYMLLFINEYYSAIFLGALLYLLVDEIKIRIPSFVIFFILIISLFLGGFPSGHIEGMPITSIYKFIILPFRTRMSCIYWHFFGAALLIFCISNSIKLKVFFSKRIFIKFHTISYSFFIIHPFFISTTNKIINGNFTKNLYFHLIIHFALIICLFVCLFLIILQKYRIL